MNRVRKALKMRLLLTIGSTLGLSGMAILFLIFTIIFLIIGIVAGSNKTSAGEGIFSCSPTGEINIENWNRVFINAGKLSGTQETIIKLSEEKGIDPVLFAAIALHETGFGTSNAIVNLNNPGGLMGKNGLMTFATLDDGLEAMANTLYNRIVRDGLVTVEALGSVYAPIGADNDPNNLNIHWVPNVTKIATDLGGLIMNCESLDMIEIIGDKTWPVPHTKNITSSYGPRWGKFHNGIDITAGGDKGKPIVSFMDGVVVVSQFGESGSGYGGYGNVVVIQHVNGIKTLYAHLDSRRVTVGEKVEVGQIIGTMGNTGNVKASNGGDGTHLHFEIRINDKPVDPMPYLKDFLHSN